MMKRLSALTLCLLLTGGIQSGEIPLQQMSDGGSTGWELIAFGKRKPNTLRISDDGLKLKVNNSSGPLVYRFDGIREATGFTFKGSVDDLVSIPDSKIQGNRGADDFVLRFGVVVAGGKQLNALQMRISPEWVRKMAEMAPDGVGVEKIYFYNVANGGDIDWEERRHPDGKGLLEEKVVSKMDRPGEIELDVEFDAPLPIIGLWIGSDGDDTGSKFNLTINRIELH